MSSAGGAGALTDPALPLDERAFSYVIGLATESESAATAAVRALEQEARDLTPAERFQPPEIEALRAAATKVQGLMRVNDQRGWLSRTLREIQIRTRQTRRPISKSRPGS
jgi:hypothetical protein